MRLVEKHARRARCAFEDRPEQMSAATADVAHDVEPGKIVGAEHARDLGMRFRRHRLAEYPCLLQMLSDVREHSARRRHFNARPPSAQRVCEVLGRGEERFAATGHS